MQYETAKCPSCGASIPVQPESEQAFCPACGNRIIVKDAIEKYQIEVLGPVKVDTNIESIHKSAEGFLALKSWDDAIRLFNRIVELDSTDYRAWWGLTRAYTKDFTCYSDTQHIRFYENALNTPGFDVSAKLIATYQDYRNKCLKFTEFSRRYYVREDAVYYNPETNSFNLIPSKKSKKTAFILWLPPLGFYGLHKFYVGDFGVGLFYLFSCGGFMFGWFADMIALANGTFKDGEGKVLVK